MFDKARLQRDDQKEKQDGKKPAPDAKGKKGKAKGPDMPELGGGAEMMP